MLVMEGLAIHIHATATCRKVMHGFASQTTRGIISSFHISWMPCKSLTTIAVWSTKALAALARHYFSNFSLPSPYRQPLSSSQASLMETTLCISVFRLRRAQRSLCSIWKQCLLCHVKSVVCMLSWRSWVKLIQDYCWCSTKTAGFLSSNKLQKLAPHIHLESNSLSLWDCKVTSYFITQL